MSQAIAGWSSFHVAVGSLGRQSLSLRHSMGRLPLCRAESGEARDRRTGSQGRARGRCDREHESGVRNRSRMCERGEQARMAPPASTFIMPGHSSAQKSTSFLSHSNGCPVRGCSWLYLAAPHAAWGGELLGDSHQRPAGNKGATAVNPRALAPSGPAGCTVFST